MPEFDHLSTAIEWIDLSFENCVSHVEPQTAKSWLRALAVRHGSRDRTSAHAVNGRLLANATFAPCSQHGSRNLSSIDGFNGVVVSYGVS